jgi:hypothetical protein
MIEGLEGLLAPQEQHSSYISLPYRVGKCMGGFYTD